MLFMLAMAESLQSTNDMTFVTPTLSIPHTRMTKEVIKTPNADLSSNYIRKVSLVKLPSLENSVKESPLSPTTLAKLIEEQTKSHEAIEALQQRILSETPVTFTTETRKELKESALKQRSYLNHILTTPRPNRVTQGQRSPQPMLAVSSNLNELTPLAKTLFPNGLGHDDVIPSKDYVGYFSKKFDTDNDTGVESDSSSDAGGEAILPVRHTDSGHVSPGGENDPLLLYLEAIERKALEMESLLERARLDTVLKIKRQMEAEFSGAPLEEIPAKCHEKIERAIQRYLARELEAIRTGGDMASPHDSDQRRLHERIRELEATVEQLRENGAELSPRLRDNGEAVSPRELQRQNRALAGEVLDLEASVSRLQHDKMAEAAKNEHLSDRITRLERQLANKQLVHDAELEDMKLSYEEDLESNTRVDDSENTRETLAAFRDKLERAENRATALKVASEADQTTIKCLELKLTDVEQQLSDSRARINDLLNEIHELRGRVEETSNTVTRYEFQLKEVSDERRLLKETLVMSEHEIRLLEEKLDNESNGAWQESKVEILEELRKLEKHIRTIHREKRKLETKFLAFKIENENLTDSMHLLNHTLTPLGSRDVSARLSSIPSHSSSHVSSRSVSDVEDEADGSMVRKHHSSTGRRRKRGQDLKNEVFAEAVSKKLIFAQKAMKDENCNFSSFDNSGDVLLDEADQLVKKVESLQAEKLAIKKELESVRTTKTS